MFQVNALGKACPLPVVETRKALKEHDAVQTLVDNRIATENLQKMARQLGCSCSVTEDGPAHYTVVITKGEAAEAVPEVLLQKKRENSRPESVRGSRWQRQSRCPADVCCYTDCRYAAVCGAV